MMLISEVFRSGVSSAEKDQIRSRTWHLDCPVLRLTRFTGAKDLVCEGAGEVRLTPDGLLTFKLITNLPDERPSELEDVDLVAGVLVSEGKYLNLHAEDVYGRTWFSKRLRPDRLLSGPAGDVISGVLDQLEHNEVLPDGPGGSQFSWWTDETLKIRRTRVLSQECPSLVVRGSPKTSRGMFGASGAWESIHHTPGGSRNAV